MSRRMVGRFAAVAVVACVVAVASAVVASSGTHAATHNAKGKHTSYNSFFKGLKGQHIAYWTQAGGVLATDMKKTIAAQLKKRAGVNVSYDFYCCGLGKLAAQQQSHNPQWDVLEFGDGSQQALARKKHYLAKLPKSFPFSKLQKGTYNRYGIVKERFAAVLAWNTNVWPKSGPHPTKLTDIFNTKEFPGKRCLFGSPDFGGTLEVALLADGVSPQHMYPINIDRALKKLGTIKNDIVWWTAGDQATQDLLSGECNLGLVWQGRVYDRFLQDPSTPLAISWNHPIVMNAWLGIQKGTHHLRAAEAYLACQVLCTRGLRGYVKLIAYPTPVKGLYKKLPKKVRPWVATGPNIKGGIVQNDLFYAKHLQAFTTKFNAFMSG